MRRSGPQPATAKAPMGGTGGGWSVLDVFDRCLRGLGKYIVMS
jgi:hypothetical protein